jgi:ribonuclease G
MKTKGARLTTEISLPGRFLVYVPNGEGLGVSRRLEDGERTRLKEVLKRIAPATGGVIVRTAADGASADDIERDLVFLQRLWKTIQARQKLATGPELVYQEAELPLRIVRDLFAGDFVSAHVDSERTYKRIVGYLKKTSPHMIERVHRTKDKEPLFAQYGVDKEIESTLNRRVDLPSGGYLIFDYAEAFTVIDVNTGSFVGSRSKSSTQRLEDTIVKNNLEAVKEVVRQLRLRDIGGIVVIDFIDMANPKNRQAVEEAFRTELERDRTKTYVVEISPLGLVEMTRQKVTDGPREVMTRKCPTCGGDGIVVSDATVALQVERRLKALAAAGAGSRIQAYRIALHPRTLALLAGAGGARLAALEDAARRRFYLVPAEGHAHLDHFEVLAEGRRDDLAPASPVAEGAEVELKLVEIDLHDGTAGVGKLDGLDVVVAEAARLVGRKAKVTVGRVLEGTAFATLAAGEQRVAPITFESEAEKPTRAPARRKADEATAVEATSELAADDAVADDEDVALDEVDEIDEINEIDELAEPGEPEAVAGEDAPAEDGEPRTPAKKRTRRGSRGGRRRKKPAAVDGEAATDGVSADDLPADADVLPAAVDGQEAVAEPPARRAPRIHVPSGDAAAAEGAVSGDAAAAEGAVSEVAPGVAAPEEGAAGDEAVDEDDRPPTAAKKRTRRGSRGGRNRKKKPAATNGDGVSPDTDLEAAAVAETATAVETLGEPVEARANGDPDVAPVTTAEPTDGSEGGYVPMSEWIGDFDRRP